MATSGIEPSPVDELIEHSTRALLAGQLDRAETGFLDAIAVDPGNEIAHDGLKNVVHDRILARWRSEPGDIASFLAALAPYRQFEIPRTRTIRLAVPIGDLVKLGISQDEAFVVSRLAAGRLSLADLAKASGRPEDALLSIVEQLLERKIVALG